MSARDGTHGYGCGFGKNLHASKPVGLEKIHPQVDLWVYFSTHTRIRIRRILGAHGYGNRYNTQSEGATKTRGEESTFDFTNDIKLGSFLDR